MWLTCPKRAGTRVHHIGAENRFYHRLFDLHSLHYHRFGGSQRADVHGHDDAVANDDLHAVQAALVRAS